VNMAIATGFTFSKRETLVMILTNGHDKTDEQSAPKDEQQIEFFECLGFFRRKDIHLFKSKSTFSTTQSLPSIACKRTITLQMQRRSPEVHRRIGYIAKLVSLDVTRVDSDRLSKNSFVRTLTRSQVIASRGTALKSGSQEICGWSQNRFSYFDSVLRSWANCHFSFWRYF
jgi:hypothetical protein